jgi:hypothetical protein
MAAEPHERPRRAPRPDDHATENRAAPPRTFFVGRRPFEAPELYAVTATSVERLGSARRFGTSELDWHAADAASMLELSHALLAHLAEQTPSRQLVARFVADILIQLPSDGFVLGSEAILPWIHEAGGPHDWSPTHRPQHRSWLDRLRSLVRRGGS